MNKKEILMICLIICFIFSLQAVVAADADLNTTDGDSLSVPAVGSVETVDASNDLSSYSLSNDDSIVRGENDGAGSFSELQEKINEDTTGTISLDKNYTFNSSSDSGLTNGIVISKDITIQGNDFTIDALSSARIFNITSGNTVTLIGINFVNGGSESVSDGGSIYSSAQGLTIDNCNFVNSYAAKDGGALYIGGDNCVLANSTFANNVAGDDGGAINWLGNKGIIYNVNFTNNRGISSGTSHSKGGSISLIGSHITVDKSTFADSSVTYNGGALFITGNDVNITNCDFTSCTSDVNVSPDGDDLPYGGAIYIIGNATLIDECTFEDCNATNGGVIYIEGNGATIDHSTFTGNYAKVDGGGIYVAGDNCILGNSTFDDNVAGDDGGAINWVGSYGTIYNVNFNNNKGISSGTSHSKGGSISLIGNSITIDKSTFTDSSVTYNGGALFITGNDVNITNCDFTSCTSDVNVSPDGDDLPYGGAIYIIGNATLIDECTFEDCNATNGGVIYIEGNGATIDHSTFTGNYAKGDGGAIYVAGDNCILGNSTFDDNVAGDDGGAINWVGDNGIVYNVNFTNNKGISSGTSHSKGGSISIIGDNISIDKSKFSDSSVTYNGGALFITGDDVNITDCEFINCKSDAAASPSGDDLPYGGAMYIIGDNTRVKGSTIRGSSARAGGAIYIEGANTVIEDSSFTNNIAKSGTDYDTTNLGGAIYVKGDYTTISGSEFESSSAYSGGTIYLQGNYCNVTESSVSGGYASNDGGAIYSTGSYSNVVDSNFTDNEAQGDGGAIYWYGGSNSKYNTIIGSSFVDNIAYARTSSNTKGGGAIYWSEGGSHGSIKDSQFINNSVRSNTKADGGAILWDRSNYALIDNCIFDGNYITTTATGDVWVQGGSIYLRADSQFTISNSVFNNSVSDKEAGAIYIQSKTLPAGQSILIVNTTFSNNVAKAIGPNIYGGGAVQIKECNRVYFRNVTFENNTANQGGAVSIYKANDNIQFDDCVFIGNDATNNGGSFWIQSHAYLYNISISNSTAANNGGGIYAEGELTNNNLTFINNTALNGGGLYMNRNAANNLQTMTFTNNTATQYGGGVYLSRGTNTLTNVNMTGNKAFSGSAIYSAVAFKLINAYLIKNQANSSSLTFATYSEDTGEVVLLFKGKDKYLNAIYVTGSNRPTCTNVTYWNENGIANTGSSATTLPNAQDPTPEAGQNITVGIYDDTGRLLNPDNQYFITDANGKVYLNFHEIIPDVPASKYGEIYVEAILTNDDYYTIIKLTSRAPSSINASATPTTYHSNSTISVNVTQGATGNVSVYLNDTFLGNITLENSKGSMELSTLIEGKYLPAGNHTLSFVYGGNAKYDVSNTTAILEINKITPVILLNVTGLGYNLIVNVTVMDGEYGIADATGNVTIQVAGRTATIYLGNSQGMTIIYGVPIGNYTVNATYNGDNNYYPVTNSTDANVTEKTQTVLIIDLDNEKTYFINETVPIKVTILPNAEGNITLYINGVPHVLPLEHEGNSTFVNFNATELMDGINYVFATYDGTELYAPSWAQDSFNVTKYNATIDIDATDITYGDTEVINITLPEDATGILNVTVNGTSYYVEIINGTASLPVSNLGVGEYNVTVRFNEDKKYYNATNSRLFKVNKATPSLNITVENITYGENATVVVTLPDGVSGNVTIKLGEDIVFTEAPIDGQATFTLKDLPASNYTIEATFNGNENYTVVSNSTNFTVFKATPIVNVTVEDIYYGDAEHIIIKVDTEGNVTVKVNGAETVLNVTSQGNETYVYDLAVGSYPVEVTFNGNENYTNLTVTKEFNVYPVNTTLDVQVHDILVWDKESINVTIADNATGNVIININGENHTVPIVNGTAQLNLTDLSVGHKVVWVFYDGDKNYTANRTMAEFDVGQRTPEVNVTALNVTVDQDGLITINIPENATGFVILSGNFTKHPIYVDEFTNGKAEIAIGGLAVGTYSVHIKYYGDALDNYTVAENDTTFTVGKINVTVSIDVDNITYMESANITVTVPEGVTGNFTLTLNDTSGRTVTLPIVNGKVTWIVDDLAAGNYTVNAVYNGNDDYNINNTESAKFEVYKADPDLVIVACTGSAYEKATIMISINGRTEGEFVNITGLDKDYYNVPIGPDGLITLETDGPLTFDTYDIVVSYGGNNNFTSDSATMSFTPSKVTNYGLNVTAMNIIVNDDEIITVEVPDNVEDVVIWVNGEQYRNNSFTGNKATFNITGLKEGIYTVTATVNDTEFDHRNFTTIFTVNKTYPSINITVVNETGIYVGDTVKVIVSVPSDVTGNVTIEINGMEFTNTTVDGNATFYIPDITYGNKTVVATYPGDDKYRFNSTTANFTVNKRQSSVNVTVDAGAVGDDVVINVTIPANATGYVIVNVDGMNYTVNTTNGNGFLVLKDLGNGTHKVNVTYIGDDQYLPSENSTSFDIERTNTTITIAVESIDYGQKANITVTVNDDATGYITIRINETQSITLPVVNGKANWIVDGLAADNYTVYANYSGDAKYNANETSKAFEVRKIAPEITIEPIEVDGATNATVIVHITPGTTGDISITVNNKNYTGTIDENGVARITVDVLPVGEYDIAANYGGDKNYTNASAKLVKGLNVTKVDDYVMNVTAVDVKVGENTTITVNVPKDATGNVTIWVNGTTAINTTIVNGVATFNITKDIEGKYTVNATLSDPKYANKTVETVYYVTRNDTPMNITVLNDTLIYVGDVVKVVVSVPSDATGNITIEIDGKTYTNETINGNATFYITDLIHGDKSVYATYEGNNKYVSNSTTANFTVYKRDSFVKVNVTNSTVGSGAVINVTVPKNATGQVIVSINGIDYSINVTNGTGSITVYNLGNGTYDVNVTYTGDEQYLASNNSTKLGIEKIQPTISVNGTNITAGEGEFITIETPDNITSIVKVEIDGKNYTAFISEGKGNLTVYGLAAGKYNVTVYFEGNDKYLNASAKNSFIVSQNSTSIDVSVMNITYTENETVIVYVDATGNVTLTIDSIGYANTTDIVDGKAIFVIKDLAAGNYTVNATFNGNVNLTMSSKEANFTVFKATPEVNVTVTNITYYDIENIVVAVNTGGNVTVKVNGTIVAENVALNSNNSITIPVKDLKAGTYPVEVTFNGNANYTDGTVSTFFVVNKAATTLDVQVADIAVDGKEVINVTISNVNATGNVIINVDGVNYTRPIANGQANLTLDKLANGTHSVVVIYEGDANLTGSWISKTFNVSKLSSQLTINVTNTTTDGVETIKVNVTAGATGTVVITVDGINHHVEIEDGFATLVLSNLTAGIHDVHAEYLGDANYTGCEGDASFNVEKINSTVSVNVDNITVGDVAVINITVTPNATGNVTIKIGDEFTQTVGIIDGVISVNVPDLTVGDKTVEVIYNGDGKYLPSNATAKFTVGKTAAEIQLLVENVTYGEVETITIFVNATGNVTIEIDGMEPVVRDIVGGKVVYPVSELNAGNYTVKVTYNGNDDVNSTSAEANFTVFKADPIITVDVEDIIYGNVEHIIVHSNAEGNVTIKVNGQEVTIVLSEGEGGHAVLRAARWDVPEYDGKATLDVYGLPVGNYPVEVIFNGNENYNKLTVNTDFDVIKDKTEVSVQVESPINVGESQVIKITVNNTNVTGNVTINIDGQNYTAELTNGTANFTVPPLASGNHTVVVVYDGDNNFTGNWTSANIVVNKLESTVNITVSNGTVGSKQTITVEVPQNATGQVLIDINDQHYYANITDGKAILELDTLPEGEYSVNATYLGDENYTSSHDSDKFIVTKNKSTVNITPQNITFGENEVITFTVPEDATGNITVVVNNKTYIVPVSGGQGNLTVPDLHAGEYTINATYNGDDKYLPSQNNATFKVDKKDVELDVIDQGNRTVIVTVSDNATGSIEIKIDGETYNATIENGKAVITLTNATPGEHEIEVTYSGDADHNNKTTNAAINAPKYDAPISAEVDSIYVGDKALINVTLPEDATGNVTVEINGKVYEPVSFENGVAKFEIEDLAFGDKTVAVKYSGDSNYLANSTTTNFTVSKRNSTVNVSDISIDVGEDAVINVTVPENATGWVHVTIGNNTYAIKVEDGKGSTTISGLSSGTYDVEAVYLGDDQYLPSNNTFTIKVSKVPSSVNISVENITVGDKAVIDITVPEDVCGNVTVTVNGKNHTVFVSGGHGTLVIPDLPVGNYTVEAIFDGCKKYEPSNNTANFTVSKIKSVIRPIDLGNNTVIVVVPENATGNVTIKVGNNTYVANVTNGTATITLDNETPGTHDITVIYSGDENHTSTTVDSTVNIVKLDTPIKVSVKDIKVGDDEVVTVTLPKDATGKVTFEIDGRKYTVDVKDGKATVHIPNLAAGSKTIAVSYSGDAKYLPNTSTAKFKVSKRESTISAKSKNINVGTDEVIIVNVPKDATGRVLVNINGVGYYANVINGVAKVIIPELPSGKYTAKVTYEGNAKYLQSKTITTTFTVTKVKTPISADGDDIEQGQEATVIVKVPNDATGTVTIGVNGKKYTNYVEDGKAVFEISGLKKGDYNVEASYSGDKKYEANNTITDIIVNFHDDDNGNHAGNGGSQDSSNGVNLADHPTGNPIFALLLILVVLASTQIRRFKK